MGIPWICRLDHESTKHGNTSVVFHIETGVNTHFANLCPRVGGGPVQPSPKLGVLAFLLTSLH